MTPICLRGHHSNDNDDLDIPIQRAASDRPSLNAARRAIPPPTRRAAPDLDWIRLGLLVACLGFWMAVSAVFG